LWEKKEEGRSVKFAKLRSSGMCNETLEFQELHEANMSDACLILD
jgi:hypothetical protein